MCKFQKTSSTSVRVMETLKVLSKSSASIQEIINHFEKLDPNNRVYTSEVILKYINTLKVFGYRFTKAKDKYVLLNTPSRFDFNERELKTIFLIEKFSELLPEETVKTEINKFLQGLERRFDDNTKLLSNSVTRSEFLNLDFDYKKYAEKIKEYEKYCQDGQKIKITYRDHHKLEISIMVEPNEIKYRGTQVYLRVYNPLSAQIQDVNFNSILKVKQLPLKSNTNSMFSSMTFQLKDRLAKNYKLHEGEKLLQVKTDGSIIIMNQKEDRILLLRRLMKYGEHCEVVSPKSLREEMSQIIANTLKNYG